MNDSAGLITVKRLRAPREDGQALLDPAPKDDLGWFHGNVVLRRSYSYDLHGSSLAQVAAEAQQDLLRAARRHTAAYRDLPREAPPDDAPVILVGHQPDLVHPGVWFKNFVLSELAARLSAHAVHIICDNDAVHAPSIRVPAGSADRTTVATVAYDRPSEPTAHEQRPVLDRELFESFGRRVAETIRPLIARPLVESWWPRAVEAMRGGAALGEAIAQARHRLEGQWGLATLEVPLSRLCRRPAFQQLALHLLCHAQRFRAVHNEALAVYRTVNRVRSHTHPVPNLHASDGWLETPFWIWSDEHPARQPAFVRRAGDTVHLTDRAALRIRLPLSADRNLDAALETMDLLERSGIHLRPRALLTTMFARLLLGDAFIHGIGGAKYDELTDMIIRRFFGLEPPVYMVATMTAMLPVPRPSIVPEDIRRIDGLLRQLEYHPELHVDPSSPEAAQWVEQKRRLIAQKVPGPSRRARHRQLERIRSALQSFVAPRRTRLLEEKQQLLLALRRRSILASREYAFCLFPEAHLRSRLLDLSRQEP